MKYKLSVIILILILLSLSGCTNPVNQDLKEQVELLSFQLGALEIANKDLRLDLADEKLENIRLQAHEQAYSDMIEILKYNLTYEWYLQERMTSYGISYPENIVEAIMQDLINEGVE